MPVLFDGNTISRAFKHGRALMHCAAWPVHLQDLLVKAS